MTDYIVYSLLLLSLVLFMWQDHVEKKQAAKLRESYKSIQDCLDRLSEKLTILENEIRKPIAK